MYQDEQWFERQKRYEKLIRSYQQNDLSREYEKLEKKLKRTNAKLNQKLDENIQLYWELADKEKEIDRLKKELKSIREYFSDREIFNYCEYLILIVLLQHFQSFNDLNTDFFIGENHQEEKEWHQTMNDNKKIKEQTTETNSQRVDKLQKEDPKNIKRTFHYSDLQSYDSAYLLPKSKQQKNSQQHFDKKIVRKKLKEKAAQRKSKVIYKNQTLIEDEKLNFSQDKNDLTNGLKMTSITEQHGQKPQNDEMSETTLESESFESKETIPDEKGIMQQIYQKLAKVVRKER